MGQKLALAAATFAALGWALPAPAEQAVTPQVAQSCAGCHGQSGDGSGPILPLAGYDREDFLQTWEAFRSDTRPATIMGRIARGFSDDEIAELADYFSSLR